MDALLLDFNGVVVDDEPLHFASFRTILGEDGMVLDESSYYAEFLGFDDRAAFREALHRNGRPSEPAQIHRLVARKAAVYAALAEGELVIVPGVSAFVRAAAERARIAVVSGALRAEIQTGLARAGIADLIEYIISTEDVPTTKPDPAGFRLALHRLRRHHGGDAWRAVVVEDSRPGLVAARALGAGCVMLTTSHDAPQLGGADLIWDSFDGHTPAELEMLWRTVAVA
jgi:HAD superfamily hydrolase (TIGR01509 family)